MCIMHTLIEPSPTDLPNIFMSSSEHYSFPDYPKFPFYDKYPTEGKSVLVVPSKNRELLPQAVDMAVVRKR